MSRLQNRYIFQPAKRFIPSKPSLSTASPPTSDGYAQKPTVLNNSGADPSRNNTNRTLEFLFLTLSLAAEASREILKLDMCFQRCLFRVLRRAVGAEDTNSGVLGKSACLASFGLNLPSLTPFSKQETGEQRRVFSLEVHRGHQPSARAQFLPSWRR